MLPILACPGILSGKAGTSKSLSSKIYLGIFGRGTGSSPAQSYILFTLSALVVSKITYYLFNIWECYFPQVHIDRFDSSSFQTDTTLGRGLPVNSCLQLTATCSSASSVSPSSLSVSIVYTFVDSICLDNNCGLLSLFSFSLLIFSFCNDLFRIAFSVTVI